ncbi:hypothetical protein EV681_0837 [Advenella incenata]|uniref:Uncharacterized protein n=1 Tax=Advenella incenata TaxID=267800 RepID=A0A4V2FTQ5_9BURK|nr:hypothetical protein EV681_0837 [Advenella incenata]
MPVLTVLRARRTGLADSLGKAKPQAINRRLFSD